MTVSIVPVTGIPEVRPGDDLVAVLAEGLRRVGAIEADTVAVTSKIVSKAEGRLTEADPARAVAAESSEVVARRGELVIARTRHGYVCANAGVDASNVDRGQLALLPLDPDASAERLRDGFRTELGFPLGVVITDTFGRPWRRGLVNVAIGCAGLPSAIDLRGETDDRGRILEATVVALADEVAAAVGLVMAKDARIPAALVRGIETRGAPDAGASALIRPPEEDLFPRSPLWSIASSREVEAFGDGGAPPDGVEEAVAATLSAAGDEGVRIEVRPISTLRVDDLPRGATHMVIVWSSGPADHLTTSAILPLAIHAAGWASHRMANIPDVQEARTHARLGGSWDPIVAVAVGPPPRRDGRR